MKRERKTLRWLFSWIICCVFFFVNVSWAGDDEEGISVEDNSGLTGCKEFVTDLVEGLTDADNGKVRVDAQFRILDYLKKLSKGSAGLYQIVLETAVKRQGNLGRVLSTFESAQASQLILCFLNKKCRLPGEKFILFPLVFADSDNAMLFNAHGNFRPYAPNGVSTNAVLTQPLFFSRVPGRKPGDIEVVLSLLDEVARFTAWVDLVRIAQFAKAGGYVHGAVLQFLTLDASKGASWNPGFVYTFGVLRGLYLKRHAVGILADTLLLLEGEEKMQLAFDREAEEAIGMNFPRTEKVLDGLLLTRVDDPRYAHNLPYSAGYLEQVMGWIFHTNNSVAN